MSSRRRFLLFIAALVLLLWAVRVVSGPSGSDASSVQVNGVDRTYLLHLPAGFDASRNYPLVLVFHGGQMHASQMRDGTDFDAAADARGFIVVYPESFDGHWNDGRSETASGIDDVAFVRSLIAHLKATLPIDASRIYATGASNGGVFAHRLGCDMADTFAAIAPVIGPLASDYVSQCAPVSALSVLMIQGTADPYISYEGGEEGNGQRGGLGGAIESAQASARFWATENGCAPTPSVTDIPPQIADGTSVTALSFSSCRDGVETLLLSVHGGGHAWYPNTRPVRQLLMRTGTSSQNMQTTTTIADFFLAHPKL